MHYRARSYDPRVGRFVQRDPHQSTRILEHYMYGAWNPLRHTDPSGLQSVSDIEREILKDGRFYESYVWLKFHGFEIDRKSFVFANSEGDVSGKKLWIDNDHVSASEAASWVKDATRKAFAKDDHLRLTHLQEVAAFMNTQRYTYLLDAGAMIEVYEFASWIDPKTYISDTKRVLSGDGDGQGAQNFGTYFLNVVWWDQGFKPEFRDNVNQVQHVGHSMHHQDGWFALNGWMLNAVSEARGSSDWRLNSAISDVERALRILPDKYKQGTGVVRRVMRYGLYDPTERGDAPGHGTRPPLPAED